MSETGGARHDSSQPRADVGGGRGGGFRSCSDTQRRPIIPRIPTAVRHGGNINTAFVLSMAKYRAKPFNRTEEQRSCLNGRGEDPIRATKVVLTENREVASWHREEAGSGTYSQKRTLERDTCSR
jgi:hypothetical protein